MLLCCVQFIMGLSSGADLFERKKVFFCLFFVLLIDKLGAFILSFATREHVAIIFIFLLPPPPPLPLSISAIGLCHLYLGFFERLPILLFHLLILGFSERDGPKQTGCNLDEAENPRKAGDK